MHSITDESWLDETEIFLMKELKMILLEYRDKDTNDINCICSLSSFVEENNYDDLEKDIAKIKNSKVGDIVIEDHANIVRRIK